MRWIEESRPLECVAGLDRTEALRAITHSPAAASAITASPQFREAHRWADRVARTDERYLDVLRRGFAIQGEVRRGRVSLAEAERWAVRYGSVEGRRTIPVADVAALTPGGPGAVAGRRLHGADVGPAWFARELVDGWLIELDQSVLSAPVSPASRRYLLASGVELLTWLANSLTELPDGAASADGELRKARRRWPVIAPRAVNQRQSDAARRLLLGTCTNGRDRGRTPGLVPWIAHGRTIRQARTNPAVASCWAVAVDQADPTVATLPRASRDRRHSQIRRDVARRLQGDAPRLLAPARAPLEISATRELRAA